MIFTQRISTTISLPLAIVATLLVASIFHTSQASEKQNWTQVNYTEVEEERVLNAIVEAVHKATISAQTSGRVVKINADVDDTVNKGDILVEFRNKEQTASYNVAKAALEESEAEYARVQDIYAKKLVSKSALDKASSRYKSDRARLETATEALENTIVRAPYSGIVVKRHIEVGELANTGRTLMTGISLEKLRANISLPQDLVNVVREKNKATAILNDGQRLALTNITVSPYADTQSHTFQVRAELPKGNFSIYPGMFIKVAIVSGVKKSLILPASAIAQRSEVSAVYVIDESNNVSFRQVRLGTFMPATNSYEILAGLENNEKVMRDPIAAVKQLKLQD